MGIMKPKKPTQKPIQNVDKVHFVNEYQKIINKLTQYYEYYEWMMRQEIKKHEVYFNELIKIIKNEK
jgi:precorrin-3B methylase